MIALDLYCGAGGAGEGLRRAGFKVIGVDVAPQPNYRAGRFVNASALDVIRDLLVGGDFVPMPDFIWASPPCQGRTAYKRRPNHVKPVDTDGMIADVRKALKRAGVPYVIENVPGAPLQNFTTLCGSMFGLSVRRHRIFEASFPIPRLPCRHDLQRGDFPQATNRKNRRRTAEIGVWRIPLDVQREAMGVDWMTLEELSESIPPAYAEHIGRAFIRSLDFGS